MASSDVSTYKSLQKKNLEAFFITAKHPTLNEQKDSKKHCLEMLWLDIKSFVNSFSGFVFFGKVVFCILDLYGQTYNDEHYFNMVTWQISLEQMFFVRRFHYRFVVRFDEQFF